MERIIQLFQERTGYKPNLDDPQTYCEKVTYDKLFRRDDRKITYSDKAWSRKFIEGKSEAKPIPEPDGFPVVVKPNNYSGRVRVCETQQELDKAIQDFKALPNDYGKEKLEWWYSEIEPQLVFEKYIPNFTELKFFCYDGKAKYIYYRIGKQSRTFFDIKGNNMGVDEIIRENKMHTRHEESLPDVDLDRMRRAAETLSEGFDQVRVDLVWADEIYFTEFTFAHWSGMVQWEPKSFDYALGEHWQI